MTGRFRFSVWEGPYYSDFLDSFSKKLTHQECFINNIDQIVVKRCHGQICHLRHLKIFK